MMGNIGQLQATRRRHVLRRRSLFARQLLKSTSSAPQQLPRMFHTPQNMHEDLADLGPCMFLGITVLYSVFLLAWPPSIDHCSN